MRKGEASKERKAAFSSRLIRRPCVLVPLFVIHNFSFQVRKANEKERDAAKSIHSRKEKGER